MNRTCRITLKLGASILVVMLPLNHASADPLSEDSPRNSAPVPGDKVKEFVKYCNAHKLSMERDEQPSADWYRLSLPHVDGCQFLVKVQKFEPDTPVSAMLEQLATINLAFPNLNAKAGLAISYPMIRGKNVSDPVSDLSDEDLALIFNARLVQLLGEYRQVPATGPTTRPDLLAARSPEAAFVAYCERNGIHLTYDQVVGDMVASSDPGEHFEMHVKVGGLPAGADRETLYRALSPDVPSAHLVNVEARLAVSTPGLRGDIAFHGQSALHAVSLIKRFEQLFRDYRPSKAE